MNLGILAFLFAAVVIFSALAGLGVRKTLVRITLRILSWAVTAFLVGFIFAIWGWGLLPFIVGCIAVLVRLILEFIPAAIVVGKDNGDISEYFSTFWLATIMAIIVAVVFVLIIAGIVVLAQAVQIDTVVSDMISATAR